jgi:type IV fimbrial biogenesis protein FimT
VGIVHRRGRRLFHPFPRQRGYSLTESLVALTVAGVLGSGAIAFSSLVSDTRRVTELNEMMTGLAFARSTAIKTGSDITLCPASDLLGCDDTLSWDRGWILFTDDNRNRAVDTGEQVLLQMDPLSASRTLHFSSGYYRYITFAPDGSVFPNGTFVFCSKNSYRRAIILYRTGRARVSDRDSSGKPLKCQIS